MNQAIHMIDMLLWMVGVPNEVYGRWATLKHGEYIDVEDTACATVGFENGAMASIVATTTLRSIDESAGLPSCGPRRQRTYPGAFRAAGAYAGDHRSVAVRTPRIRSTHGRRPRAANLDFPGFHSDQLRDFARAILEDREPIVTGFDAVRALEVIKAVYLSEARRAPIVLPMSAGDRAEADRITMGVS